MKRHTRHIAIALIVALVLLIVARVVARADTGEPVKGQTDHVHSPERG